MSNPLTSNPLNYCEFNSSTEQFVWIVDKIRELVNAGQNLGEIAVISRRHASLVELSKYLQAAGIPIFYERSQNILEKPHIRQLLTILKFTHSLMQKGIPAADELLPEILAYPFWQIPRHDLWLLSVYAYSHKEPEGKLWLEVMQQADRVEVLGQKLSESAKLQNIAEFLLHLAVQAKYMPVERLIDQIVGSNNSVPSDELSEDAATDNWPADTSASEMVLNTGFKRYYFDNQLDLGQQQLTLASLDFLSSLRALIAAVRQYRSKETLYLPDLLEFTTLLEKNKLPLVDNSPFGDPTKAVNLLTAHKAKGLEFEVVFITDCLQDEWFAKRRGQKLGLPMNLPFLPDSDNQDDQLRLLYVAITRAKFQVYFCTYRQDEHSGKELLSIDVLQQALEQLPVTTVLQSEPSQSEHLCNHQKWYQAQQSRDFVDLEKNFLTGILKDYQLSATHLNNFLDVQAGGPRRFLEQNLLHFPQARSSAASFGTAIHAAIRAFLEEYQTRRQYPDESCLLDNFRAFLSLERLPKNDFQEWEKLGIASLQAYYNYAKTALAQEFRLEFNFAKQEVCLGEARLTGQIDLMEFTANGSVVVTDFKTGKALPKWDNSSDPIKAWRYRNQLIFYKILVENSRAFKGKYQVQTGQLLFLDAFSRTEPEIFCLPKTFDAEEIQELSQLIEIVYQKIVTLDFPPTDHYSLDYKGIQQFTQDLLTRQI